MPFLKRSLFYYLVTALVVVLGALLMIAITDGLNYPAIGGLTIILTLAFLIVAPRIALVFPAIAVGNPARSMADAFVLSSGNVLRLAAGYFLMLMVVLIILMPILIVVYFVDEYLSALSTSETYMLVSNMLIGFLAALTVLLWAGMNSSFYRQLGGDIHPTTDLVADEETQDSNDDSDGAPDAGYGDKQRP